MHQKRYDMYFARKEDGTPRYSVDEICRLEGITRQALYASLRKIDPNFKRRTPPRTWS
jgi:hypothetical protein